MQPGGRAAPGLRQQPFDEPKVFAAGVVQFMASKVRDAMSPETALAIFAQELGINQLTAVSLDRRAAQRSPLSVIYVTRGAKSNHQSTANARGEASWLGLLL